MATPQETAAYVAASLALGVKNGGMDEVLADFDKAFAHVLGLIKDNTETKPVTIKSKTVGPRNIPMVTQDDLKAKIAGAAVQTSMLEVTDGSSGVVNNIVIHSQKFDDVPESLLRWCQQNNVTHVYDNRDAQAENPRRPAFKAVDERGHDIKVNGKTLSFWDNSKPAKVDIPMPDSF